MKQYKINAKKVKANEQEKNKDNLKLIIKIEL